MLNRPARRRRGARRPRTLLEVVAGTELQSPRWRCPPSRVRSSSRAVAARLWDAGRELADQVQARHIRHQVVEHHDVEESLGQPLTRVVPPAASVTSCPSSRSAARGCDAAWPRRRRGGCCPPAMLSSTPEADGKADAHLRATSDLALRVIRPPNPRRRSSRSQPQPRPGARRREVRVEDLGQIVRRDTDPCLRSRWPRDPRRGARAKPNRCGVLDASPADAAGLGRRRGSRW